MRTVPYDPLLQEYIRLSVEMVQLSRKMAQLATNGSQPEKGYVAPIEEYCTTYASITNRLGI